MESFEGREVEIEYMEQPVPLARDIFRQSRVTQETIERTVDILKGYLQTILEYGLQASEIDAAAVSNIISEAKNHHVILNRLQIATGIPFKALDDGDMSQIVFHNIKSRQLEATFVNAGNTLAIHVGPGNTRALLLKDGNITRSSTYRIGTHRTAEALHKTYATSDEYLQVIRGHCEGHINMIKYDFRKERIDHIILIGAEIQLISRHINDETAFQENIGKYSNFIQFVSELNEEERISRFNLDYHCQEAFLPALQINYSLLHAFEIERYWIPSTEFEKSLLIDLRTIEKSRETLSSEMLHSSRLLAKKYQADPYHYEQVLKLAVSLFEQTRELHGMTQFELQLLKVAAIVHEIGGYISPKMHHKHSFYLISNSEIFGLNEHELKIVALVARYHRHSPPKRSHKEYISLTRENQVLVSKLSALLRVSDALDSAQQHKVKRITVKHSNDRLTIYLEGAQNTEVEKIALKRKGDLFEQLFGLDLHLDHNNNL